LYLFVYEGNWEEMKLEKERTLRSLFCSILLLLLLLLLLQEKG